MVSLKESIEEFVRQELSGVKVEKVRAKKLIRDALTGTMAYGAHEINVIDLPIVQRLRRIHQNGLAFLTYPCASHNRFQHSLGVTCIVDKFARSLMEKKGYKRLIGPNTVIELRLAAILHDVGHGPFSHPSEEVLTHLPDVESEQRNNSKFSKAKPHEMLSYLVITSDTFREIVDEINRVYLLNIDIDRVANMIVGDMDDPMREGYLSDLINGPFDADKLDYMPRDAYYSGLKMDVDLERIAYTTLIDSRGGEHPRRLCCDVSGAHNLEQILFNKVLLYTSMYHHHKVRAATCMFKSIFEIMRDHKLKTEGCSFKTATDFLSIDDWDIFSKFEKEPALSDVIGRLKRRQLLKRALVISRNTVKDPMKYQKLIKLSELPNELRKLRTKITKEVTSRGGKCSVYDLWIDLPDPPSLREPSQCMVRLAKDRYVTLNKIFPADWWLIAYGETKWKGHIFCPPDTDLRKLVNEQSQKVLKDDFGVEFEETATLEAKIPGLCY